MKAGALSSIATRITTSEILTEAFSENNSLNARRPSDSFIVLNESVNETGFRNCPACGNPTPSVVCSHCGAQTVEYEAEVYEESREERFLRAIIARPTRLTYLFIGINLGMFALMWLAGGMSVTGANHFALVGFGAKENSLIEQGQYWRLVTSIFLHIGFLHLFFNNYALWIIGQEIEKLYGAARFAALYMMTGIVGSVASYYFYPDATSAGASGAIFGLFGALATFAFRGRSDIPDFIRKSILRRVFPLIAINLILSFSIKEIDKAAHIGGLVAGVALAVLIPYQRAEEKATPPIWRAIMVVCIAAILISFAAAFKNYDGPPLELSNLAASPNSRFEDYSRRMVEADKAFLESFKAFSDTVKKQDEKADVSSMLRAVERGIDQISGARGMEKKSEEFRQRLLAMLIEQKNILEKFNAAKNKNWSGAEADLTALIKKHSAFVNDYNSSTGR